MARKRAEEAAEKTKMATIRAGFQAYNSVASQSMELAGMVAEAQGVSAERAARLQNRFLGMQAFGRAALSAVEAAAAFAEATGKGQIPGVALGKARFNRGYGVAVFDLTMRRFP